MKKLLVFVVALGLIIALSACSKKQDQAQTKEAPKVEQKAETASITADLLDYTMCGCGMDLAKEGAHIADTVHYHGKVLGFCGEKCKEAFLKDPEGYLAKITSEKKMDEHGH